MRSTIFASSGFGGKEKAIACASMLSKSAFESVLLPESVPESERSVGGVEDGDCGSLPCGELPDDEAVFDVADGLDEQDQARR